MKVSDYIATFLAEHGVRTVFEMTGGMITQLLDSLHHREDIAIVSVHHEQTAAFAAEGVARMTGVPGVALATSGPGATNLITGIGSCYFDSVPAVFFTGQVNTNELRGESGVRQAGFQEADIASIVGPITKGAWLVTNPAEVPELLSAAFALACAGRPGPVLLDIPMNVQRAEIDPQPAEVELAADPVPARDVRRVLDVLGKAKRPLILAGGGIRTAGAASLLREFAESCGVPVASTLMGLDVLPHGHPLRVGFIGTYGNRWANLTLRDADVVLALGARLTVRQTGADTEEFLAGKTLIKVDIDSAQLQWRIKPAMPVHAELAAFLARALEASRARSWPDWSGWRQTIAAHTEAWPDTDELAGVDGINPAEAMHALSTQAAEACAYVADVGQNQMWAAQSLHVREGQRLLFSGGMGAMGFAIPAAIGVAFSTPDRPVVAITGDGGAQVSIQELETVARLGLPVKVVVLNNNSLGMVRQLQDELFDSRYQSTVWGYGAPDFAAVSNAYGVPARSVSSQDELGEAFAWLMGDATSPALLEVTIDTRTCARPKVSFGKSVYSMDAPPEKVGKDGAS